MRRYFFAALAVAAAATAGLAQQPVHESRPVSANAEVSVNNVSGSVSVTGWTRDEVEVTGTLGRRVERLDVAGDRDHLEIRVVLPEHSHDSGDAELQIRVPAGASVDVTTVSADISAAGLDGRLEAQSVSGRVEVKDNPRSISAQSVSGDVVITSRAPEVRASSVSGNLRLSLGSGRVEASTVSGDTTLAGGPLEEVHAKTTSGDLRCDAELAPRGSFSFESLSGNLTLAVPESFPADYEISTFSGDIHNAFGPRPERTSRHAPGTELDFTTGSGGARIEVNTFSGDLTLKTK